MDVSVNSFYLVLANERVLLSKFLLLLGKVVKSAIMGFGNAMFRTENITTLAGDSNMTNFLSAVPALALISLNTYD
jgi:hypothetical protein